MDDIIEESEVAVDAKCGAEVEVGADSPFVHHTDGRSVPWPTSCTPRAGHVTW